VALSLTGAVLTGTARAADTEDPVRFQAGRVVAFADVHGAQDQLLRLLRSLDIIDENQAWMAGSTHLVSLGDLLDRGPDSRQTMDLLMRLQGEARAAGGRVHVVLGNHELMNLTGDLRYVAAEEYAAFAGDAQAGEADAESGRPAGFTAHRRAFAPDGEYGRWLLKQPPLVLINETAFVHAGLPPLAGTMDPEALANAFRARLQNLLILRETLESAGVIAPYQDVLDSAARLRRRLEGPTSDGSGPEDRGEPVPEPVPAAYREDAERFVALAMDDLFSDAGPLWYRGTARCHEMLETPVLDAVLKRWAVDRVIVGHTPTPDHRVRQRFDGRAVLADTGMLKAYYRGQPAGVILPAGLGAKDPVQVYYPETNALYPAPEPVPVPEIDGLDAAAVLPLLREGEIEPVVDGDRSDGTRLVDVTLGDKSLRGVFQPGGKRDIDNQLAAYALDRQLDLGIVAPVVERRWEGRQGALSAVWRNAIDELERTERGTGPANWCARGSVFNLMYALDALIGNEGRLPTTMIYNPSSWDFLSIGHGRAFGRGTGFPGYLQNAPAILPPRLANALRALTEAEVEQVFGDLLSRGARRSLLKRRDHLLETWTDGG
jgi:hypothetical protein